MKKHQRILALAISLLLLVGAVVGITVSAEDAVAPEIVSYNVAHGNEFRFMFAVKADTVSGETLTLTVVDEDGAEADKVTLAGEALAAAQETVNGVDCYVIATNKGVAAKDMADQYYITVEDGDAAAAAVRYSLAEYCFQRLYKDGIVNAAEGTKDYARKQLYLDTLAYGASAQSVLVNWADDDADADETPVNDYSYVYVTDGTIDGTYSAGIYANGTTVTPTYTGEGKALGWDVVATDGSVVSYELGSAITVDGHVAIEPAFSKPGNGVYASKAESFDNFTPTVSMGSIAVDQRGNSYYKIDGGNQNEIFYLTDANDDGVGSVHVVEYDIRFHAKANDATAVVNYTGMSSTSGYLHYESVRPSYLYDGDTDLFSLGFNGNAGFYTFENEIWYNVRFELASTGSAKTMYIYINNSLVTAPTAGSNANLGVLYKYAFGVRNVGAVTIDLDNMYVGTLDEDYGHRADGLFADRAENFDEYTVQANGKLVQATGADSYLKMYGSNASETFYVTEADDDGTDVVYVFEQDLRINGSSLTGDTILSYMEMQYESSEGVGSRIHDSSTRLQYLYTAGEGYSVCGYKLNTGEWYTIRMEIRIITREDGNYDVSQKLYINNEFVCNMANGVKNVKGTPLYAFVFSCREAASSMNWDIDNVFLGSMTEAELAEAIAAKAAE